MKFVWLLLLGMFCLLGIFLVLLCTSKHGINLEIDGIQQICNADAYADYSHRKALVFLYLLHQQPLFPIIISLGHFIQMAPEEIARLFNAFLFGLNGFLAGLIVGNVFRSYLAALLGGLLVLILPDMVAIHLMCMAEPLFICLMLSWILLFIRYLGSLRVSILIVGAIFVALALMTRYAGIPVVVAGVIGIFCLTQQLFLQKIRHAIIFILISSVPYAMLLTLNRCVSGQMNAREIVFHPTTVSAWHEATRVLCSWFMPYVWYSKANELVVGGVIVVAVTFSLLRYTKKLSDTATQDQGFIKFVIFLFSLILLSLLGVVCAATFYDDLMPLGWRYLLPIHIVGVIIFSGCIFKLCFSRCTSPFARDIGIIILSYFLVFYLSQSWQPFYSQYTFGDSYASSLLKYSKIIRFVKVLPEGTPIWTNSSEAVYILTRKGSSEIPGKYEAYSGKKNDRYIQQFLSMKKQIIERQGVIVYFKDERSLAHVEPMKEIDTKIPLHCIAVDSFGAVYAYDKK